MKDNTIEREWSLDAMFALSLGETFSSFMNGLAQKRVVGNKIGNARFYPPKPFCSKTLELPTELVECDGTGTVEAFTVYHKPPEGVVHANSAITLSPPYVVAAIRIGDSGQCLVHLVSGVDAKDPAELLKRVSAGLNVRPVWAEERHANILDIRYFEPVK